MDNSSGRGWLIHMSICFLHWQWSHCLILKDIRSGHGIMTEWTRLWEIVRGTGRNIKYAPVFIDFPSLRILSLLCLVVVSRLCGVLKIQVIISRTPLTKQQSRENERVKTRRFNKSRTHFASKVDWKGDLLFLLFSFLLLTLYDWRWDITGNIMDSQKDFIVKGFISIPAREPKFASIHKSSVLAPGGYNNIFNLLLSLTFSLLKPC